MTPTTSQRDPNRWVAATLILALVGLFAYCAGPAPGGDHILPVTTATPTATNTPWPTEEPTLTPTAMEVPAIDHSATATLTPTRTPMPTQTPTASPTSSPTPMSTMTQWPPELPRAGG
jgi:hypothetical protein